ncbi:MAG: hypothetical protein CMN32_00665 [Saprospirales bacterium]|nr:hypothetical protein [Saprospirales bacterium]
MQFREIHGQSWAKGSLLSMASGGRLPHAVMLIGSPGSGDLALALAFAQYVLCESPMEGDSCGQCRHCKKAARLIHPDLHFSFPTVGKDVTSDSLLPQWREAVAENPFLNVNDWLEHLDAGNKQANINRAECLHVVKKLSLKSFESPFKVLVMWLPEYMGREGNRLLKLIEEPPENTLLIFVAQKEELLLGTIVSRCQLVRVPRLKDEEIAQALQQLKSLPPEKAHLLAHLADGDLNDALKLSQNQEYSFSDLFISWLRHCYTGNGVELTAMTEKICQFGREEQKQFLQYGLHFLREMTQIKLTGEASNARLLEAEKKPAQSLAGLLSVEQLDKMSRLLNDCAYYIERNANQKLLFLDASIQVHKLFKMNRQPVNG